MAYGCCLRFVDGVAWRRHFRGAEIFCARLICWVFLLYERWRVRRAPSLASPPALVWCAYLLNSGRTGAGSFVLLACCSDKHYCLAFSYSRVISSKRRRLLAGAGACALKYLSVAPALEESLRWYLACLFLANTIGCSAGMALRSAFYCGTLEGHLVLIMQFNGRLKHCACCVYPLYCYR